MAGIFECSTVKIPFHTLRHNSGASLESQFIYFTLKKELKVLDHFHLSVRSKQYIQKLQISTDWTM